MNIPQLYADGGPFMGVILVFGVFSLIAGVVGLIVHRNWAAIVALVIGGVCLALGYAGYYAALFAVMKSVTSLPASEVQPALARLNTNGAIPMYFGAICSTPGVIGGLVALIAARRNKARG